ncbi:DET1 protein- and DDB1-associated protein 1-like protein [Aphelenchoides avenae]|nr:DET1 protein- and DDB1-associated protein 1-like protein [Aphelenchus avenae]
MLECLKDLPVHNPNSFANLQVKDSAGKKAKPKVVYTVEKQEDEKKISTDKTPLILRYLQNHWNINPQKKSSKRDENRGYASSSSATADSNQPSRASSLASARSQAGARRVVRRPEQSRDSESSNGSEAVPAKNPRI